MRKLKDLTWLILLPLIMFGMVTPAWSADSTVSALDELTVGAIADADVFYVVDTAPTPTSKKYAWSSAKGDMKTYMNTVYQGLYVVDALVTYGAGVNYTKATIDAALAIIGTTNKTVLLLAPGTWTITDDSDYSTFGNVLFHVQDGATFALTNTKTLTLPSPANLIAEKNQQIFSGTGLVSFTKPGTVYPEWWGIDGTADETETNKAFASLSTGGTVILSAPLYTISSAITPGSSVKMVIEPGTTVKLANNVNQRMIDVNTKTKVTIGGGGILDGNKAQQLGTITSAYQIYVLSSDDVTVENLTIKDGAKYSIMASGANRFKLIDCVVRDAAEYHVFLNADFYSEIKGNNFIEAGAQHIQVNNSTEPLIDKNNFIGTVDTAGEGHGIYSYYPYGFRYTNNVFKDCYGWGIEIQTNRTGYYGNISGNSFIDCGNVATSTGSIQIGAYGHVIVTGNTIRGSKIIGIDLYNSVKNIVMANTILDSGTNGIGIRLFGTSDDNIVIGNFVADEQAIETMDYGIINGSGISNVFIGNNVRDSGTYDLVFGGSTGNPRRVANVESLADWEFSNNQVDETNEQTLGGNLTILPQFGRTFILNGGVSDRTVTPDAAETWPRGKRITIVNKGTTNKITFDGNDIEPGISSEFIYSGTVWIKMFPVNQADTITVVDSTDATSYVALFDSATGNLPIKTDTGITYDSTTGILTASGGFSTSPTTTPTFTMQDSDAAPGSAGVYGMSSAGAYDVIMSLGVEDSASSTVPTVYIELDGVSETVDILKPLVASTTVTVGTSLIPDAADGATIGSSSAEWSDIYLATGAVIYGENGQTNNLTSSSTEWTASLDFTVGGGDLTLISSSAGVRLTGGNGLITFTGAGDGTNESLTLNLNSNNVATFSTGTGVLSLNFSGLNLSTTGTLGAGATTVTSLNGHTFTTGSSTFTGTAGQTYVFPSSSATLPANNQTMYIGTTGVAINRTTAALTLAGITLTTPDIGAATGTSLAVTGDLSGGSLTPVIDDPDNFAANFTGINLNGGTFICNAAGTAALPAVAVGMNFTIVLEGANAVIINPDSTGTADTIVMNGLAAAQDENITSSTSGAMCVFQYRAANSWMATCNGFSEATPP